MFHTYICGRNQIDGLPGLGQVWQDREYSKAWFVCTGWEEGSDGNFIPATSLFKKPFYSSFLLQIENTAIAERDVDLFQLRILVKVRCVPLEFEIVSANKEVFSPHPEEKKSISATFVELANAVGKEANAGFLGKWGVDVAPGNEVPASTAGQL